MLERLSLCNLVLNKFAYRYNHDAYSKELRKIITEYQMKEHITPDSNAYKENCFKDEV